MIKHFEQATIWILIVERGTLTTEISFAHAPSLEDFLQVVKQTPWMVVWEDELIPLSKKVQWPMPAGGYKRREVDLVDGKNHVGRLVIERRYVWKNQYNKQPLKQ